MTIKRWRPLNNLMSWPDRLTRYFDDEFFKDFPRTEEIFDSGYPAADIFETKDDFVFKLEMPGMSKDDVHVDVENNVLSIRGEKKSQQEVKKENYHRIESFSGSFSRSFALPRNADPSNIKAALKDGILELRVAKVEEKKTKPITISVQ